MNIKESILRKILNHADVEEYTKEEIKAMTVDLLVKEIYSDQDDKEIYVKSIFRINNRLFCLPNHKDIKDYSNRWLEEEPYEVIKKKIEVIKYLRK